MIHIRQAKSSDAEWLQTSFDTHMGWTKSAGYFADVCRLQDADEVVLLVATQGDHYLGHCKIVWSPDYPHFRDNQIPEIQDLNVRPDYRRQGVASQLLDDCEQRIKEQSDVVGIGFGLYRDYGAAQRLYIKRGYVPDGHGLHYNHHPVVAGKSYRVDDDLVLYLTKQLV